jgi:hypothetical protein
MSEDPVKHDGSGGTLGKPLFIASYKPGAHLDGILGFSTQMKFRQKPLGNQGPRIVALNRYLFWPR